MIKTIRKWLAHKLFRLALSVDVQEPKRRRGRPLGSKNKAKRNAS